MNKLYYFSGYSKAFAILTLLMTFTFYNSTCSYAITSTLSESIPANPSSPVSKSGYILLRINDGLTASFSNEEIRALPDNKYITSPIHSFYSCYPEIYSPINSQLPAPPTITCPGDTITVADPGLCTALVGGLTASYNDPDGDIVSLTWTMTGATTAASPLIGFNNLPLYTFNVGITTVTYTVTDALGATASCSFTVTVNDTQFPVITCPANINTTYDEGLCSATVSVGTATATDNCATPTVSGIRSDGLALNAPYPSGSTTITWSAADASGNTSTCTQTIKVTQGDLLVNYNFVGASAYPISPNQNATGISCEATSSEPFNISNVIGTLTGNLAFSDNTIANPSIYMDPSNWTNLRYFQFHISGDSLYKYRKYKLYVQARRGNAAAQQINFAYSIDPFSYTVNGSMSLPGANNWYQKVVDWSTVSLINNQSNLYVRMFASNGTGGAGDGRLFIDNFQVIGIDGPLARPNSASIPENTPVTIPVLNNDYFGCNGPAAVSPVMLTSFPAQGIVVLNPDNTFTYTPNPNVNGPDSFIYQICDASGSCDTGIVRINITAVNYPPTINCPGNVLSGSDVGLCGAMVSANDLRATIYDLDGNITTLKWVMTGANNDSSVSTGINYLPSYLFNFGTSTITYTVIDATGLSASCSFTVTIFDSENPSIICSSDTTFIIPFCTSFTNGVTLTLPIIGDNCPGPLVLTNDAPAQFPVGTTSVIWNVLDINGLSSQCEQVITVIKGPAIALTMSSTAESCYNGTNGSATATVTGGSPPYTYSWNTIPVQTTSTITNLSVGTYTVTVMDADSCQVTDSVTVTQPASALSASISNQVNVACFGASTGSVTIAGSDGTPPYQYSINGILFQGSGTFSGLAAGSYTITVSDANNCITTVPVVITQPPTALAAVITGQTNEICFGQNTGTATVSASGGIPPYSYSWNTVPVQTTATATGLGAGSHTATVTDSAGCTTTATVTITQPTQLSVSIINKVNVACFGQATGSATALATGGTPPYSYAWIMLPVQTTTTATNLAAGTYTVAVIDSLGCFSSAIVTITQPTQLTASIVNQLNVACFGDSTGSVTIAGSGGTPSYQYSLNGITFQPGGTFTNLTVGSYTITVEDINNCTTTINVTITQPVSPLSASITAQVNVPCFGASTGSVTVSGSGGTQPYQYSINGVLFQASGTFSNLTAGSYTITVRDSNNCTYSLPVVITQSSSLLAATITAQTNVNCHGQSTGTATVSASGGILPYSYSWNTSPVQTTATATGLAAGNYTVSVTDSAGCMVTANVTITQPAQLVVSIINKVNVACFGQATGSASASASGGTPPYSYAWIMLPVQTTATASNLSAGTYTVAVIDSLGCFASAIVTITQPASALTASITNQVNVVCSGESTGSVTIQGIGGTPSYQYSINGVNFQPGGTFNNLAAGSYTVIVRDSNNCTYSIPVVITQAPFVLTASIISHTNVSCFGQLNGTATVNAVGGIQPYTYSWNTVPVQITATATGLAAGTYTATVTDSLGCTKTASVTITQPAKLTVTIINKVNVACFGQATGSATASVTGGTPPYSYAWIMLPVQTTPTVNNLIAGTYTVAVIDSLGCFASAVVTITQPASALSASITSQTNVVCSGDSTGSVSIQGIGGTPSYQYSINGVTFQPSGTFTNLAAGSYTVTVRDANNCTYTIPVMITQAPFALSASIISQTNVNCFGQLNGSASVNAAGGILPYTYSWNTVPVQTTATATGLAAGTYTASVTDSIGCTVTATVTITQPDQLSVSIINKVNVACFGDATGSATASPSGGTPPYSFAWIMLPVQTTATVNNLVAGTYTVAVIDSLGCFSSAIVTITQPASALTASILDQGDVTCFGNTTGFVTIAGSGGTSPYQYSLDGGSFQVSGTFLNLAAGNYTVTVRDTNNCTYNLPVTINGPLTGLIASISAQTNVSCHGQATGSAVVTVTSGTPPYTYLWNTVPPQTNDTAINLAAGVYTVIVTESGGCTRTVNATITEPAAINATFPAIVNVACFGDSAGSATVNVTGGNPPYTYSWNTVPSQTTITATNLMAGNYTVTITDSTACSGTANVTISQPASALSASILSHSDVGCFGQSTGSATVTVSGGTFPYTYLWNTVPAQTTATATNLVAGSYSVMVTDTNGCLVSASILIAQPLAALSVSISGFANVACFGGSNGSATVTAVGGTSPYTYLWNTVPPQTNDTATNLGAGTYTVLVTDANGCSDTTSVTITEPSTALTATISSQLNVLCFGAFTGEVTVSASGGIPSYQYSLDGSTYQASGTFSNLAAGSYSVSVKDASNCIIVIPMDIIQPATAVSASVVNLVNADCAGNSNGSVTVAGSGGTPGYQYSLNGGTYQLSGTFSGLVAGLYTITVQDANGCTFPLPVTIGISGLLQAVNDTATTPEDIPVSGNVMTNDFGFCDPPVTVTSNTSPLNGTVVMLADGSFTYTPNLNYNGTDSFTYTITDINGITSTATVFIIITAVNDPPVTFNEYITLLYNTGTAGNVLSNGDYDPDGTALTVNTIPLVNAANGSFTIVADGSFTYTPNLDYIGNEMIIVSVCDAGIPLPPACTNDTIFIIVLPPNSPPNTVNENIILCENSGFVGTLSNGGTVFNGDTDPENNLPLTLNPAPIFGPAHGTFTITDLIAGTFDYVPFTGYSGPDMVVVSICDSGTPIECSNDTIFIQVMQYITANAGPDQLLCNADVTFLVGNNPAPGTGSWSYISGPNTPTLFPPTGSVAVAAGLIPSPTLYIFSYSINNSGCITSDTMNITNFNPPTPAYAGVDQKYCNGSGNVTATLTANTPVFGTGLWTQLSGPSTANIANPANPVTSVSNLGLGVYAFQWTITNGICQVTSDVVNIYISAPASVSAGVDGTICEGSTFVPSTSAAFNYNSLLWSSTGTGIFNNPTLLHPIYTPSAIDILNGSVALTLTATGNDPCPSVSDQMTLFINHPAMVNAGPDATICQGSTYTVVGAETQNCTGFTWSTTGSGTLTGAGTLSPTYSPATGETGTIFLILSGFAAAPCSDATDTMAIRINQIALAYAGPDTTVCEGSTYQVTGSTASGYLSLLWTSSGTGTFDDATTLNPVYTPSPTDIIDGFVFLTLTVSGFDPCPEVSDQMQLLIIKGPSANAGPDATICQGSSFTVTQASTQLYNTILWTTSGLGTLIDTTTLSPTYTPAQGESGNVILTLTVTGNAYCAAITDQMVLLVNPLVSASAGPDLATCESTPVTISGASALNSTSILWTTNGSGTFSDPSIINPVYTPGSADLTAGTVVLTLHVNGIVPCSDLTDQLLLTIIKNPFAYAGTDASICEGLSYKVTEAVSSNFSTVLWTLSPPGSGSLTDDKTLSPTFTPAAGFTGIVTLTLAVQGNSACANVVATDNLTITVITGVLANAGPDQVIQSGSTTTLSGSASAGSGFYAWNWQPANLLENSSSMTTATLPLTETISFTLEVLDLTTGCTSSDIVEIAIGEPNQDIVAVPDYDTTLVNVSSVVNVLLNDINNYMYPLKLSLCGSPAHGTVIQSNDSTFLYIPFEGFLGDDSYCYQICTTVQPITCSETAVYIHVKEPDINDLTIFNGVSPNGDGNNDFWKIKGIENYADNTVLIFNRWGNKVREFAGYNNTSRRWDGRNENGKPVPDGTYFYILEVRNVGTRTGWIHVRGNK